MTDQEMQDAAAFIGAAAGEDIIIYAWRADTEKPRLFYTGDPVEAGARVANYGERLLNDAALETEKKDAA
jgi:hypothetical protein